MPERPSSRQARQALHEAVNAAAADPTLNPGDQPVVVTRWTATIEIAYPDQRLGLLMISNDVGGADLRPWEAAGLHMASLLRSFRGLL
jgi:hypothetical protein